MRQELDPLTTFDIETGCTVAEMKVDWSEYVLVGIDMASGPDLVFHQEVKVG